MDKVIGAFEKVSFPEFGLFDVVAKVDTGALSGALHATEIEEITLPTKEKAVRFKPYGKAPLVTVTGYHTTEVRSSSGHSSLRYVVPTMITIEGVQYPIHISLADRSTMMKGVLLGRQFLRRHGFVVDARKGAKYRYDRK